MAFKYKHTILTVDDEEGILKSLQRQLRTLDINILAAQSGQEGLKLLQGNKVSIIISDQRMPGMTGVQFLQKSRELSPDSTRILLTGYADIDATIDAINNGAVKYYINKPWDDEVLLSRIKESLDMYEMVMENRRLTELTNRQNKELKQLNASLEQKVAEQTNEIRIQHNELKNSFKDTIKALSTIIEIRRKDVGNHSERVALIVKEMIRDTGLSEKEYQDIIFAAFLHDIGKVSLPDQILERNERDYTKADFEQIARHPILGQTCVFSIRGLEDAALIIRHHHEEYNGNGYPDNLEGDAIPLGSRLIRIADAFDHLAFRGAHPDNKILNSALAHLVQHSGSKFDPELVKRFVERDIIKIFMLQKTSADLIAVLPSALQKGMILASDIYTESGMFLLPKGARLSPHMINRLIKISKVDPIEGKIKVFKESDEKRVQHVPI
jgi:response regulator RpfG family c-di-GMP phosphodiesterase